MDLNNLDNMENAEGSDACTNALEQAIVACCSKIISYLDENETKRAEEVGDTVASVASAWAEMQS
jgi:hypothetical protein